MTFSHLYFNPLTAIDFGVVLGVLGVQDHKIIITNHHNNYYRHCFVGQSILISASVDEVYQENSNWPPADEWFVTLFYIRETDTLLNGYQKLLWFKAHLASYAANPGFWIPSLESVPNTDKVKVVFQGNGGVIEVARLQVPANTKVQFSIEQRRDATDGKL